MKRLPGEKRLSIPAEPLEHRDGTYGQTPERRQVRLRTSVNRRVPAAEFRQRVGVQQDWLRVRHWRLSLPRLEFPFNQSHLGHRDARQATRRHREDLRRARSDVDVLSIVTSQQRNHLAFEAAPAPLCVYRDLVTEARRKPYRSSDGRVGITYRTSHTEKVPDWWHLSNAHLRNVSGESAWHARHRARARQRAARKGESSLVSEGLETFGAATKAASGCESLARREGRVRD
jgi:hypothetical protein